MINIQTLSTPAEITRSSNTGFVLRLLMETHRSTYKAASIWHFTAPAIRLGFIQFLFNEQGVPLAYATWAFLSDRVSAELSFDDNRLLHISEWNEGTNFWLMDLVAPHGHAPVMVRVLRQRFSDLGHVRAIRRNGDGAIQRVVDLQWRSVN